MEAYEDWWVREEWRHEGREVRLNMEKDNCYIYYRDDEGDTSGIERNILSLDTWLRWLYRVESNEQ